MKHIKIKRLSEMTINVSQLIVTLFCMIIIQNQNISLKALGIITLVNLFFIIFAIYLKQQRFFTIYMIFFIVLSVFHFGQLWIYSFNLPVKATIAYDIIAIYDKQSIVQTVYFCLLGTNVLNTIGIFFIKKSSDIQQALGFNEKRNYSRIYKFGLILFIIFLIPVLVNDFILIQTSQSTGYVSIYNLNLGILGQIETYFPIAIIFILISAKETKNNWKFFYYFAIIRALIVMVLVGNRGPLLISIIIYIYVKHKFVEQYSRRHAFIIIAFGAFMVSLLPFISYIRSGSNNIGYFDYLVSENPVIDILSELGSTLVTPILARFYTFTNGFLVGKSFIGSLTTFSPFSDVLFSSIRKYISVSSLLNQYLPINSSLGGSFFAEMYINFGWYSLILIAFFGYIVSIVSMNLENFRNKSKPLFLSVNAYFCIGLLLYTRGNFIDVVFNAKRIIYVLILYYSIFFLLKLNRKKEIRQVELEKPL